MASPYPQPLAIAKLKGSDKKDPQRYRDRKAAIQAPLGVGKPPSSISPGAQRVWEELTPTMVEGVLTVLDNPAWHAFCELYAEFKEDPRAMNGTRLTKMITLFSLFGMTPVDRMKIRLEKPGKDKPDNPFEAFAA